MLTRFEQVLNRESISVEGRTIRPVALRSGWQIAGGQGENGFGSAWGRIGPQEIIVQEGDEEISIPIVDPTHETLQGIVLAAGIVSGLCIVIIILTRLLKRR